jgi:hypothetical protein
MDVPAKIRLLNHVRKVVPMWALKQQALVIEHSFDSDLAKAKDDPEARSGIIRQRDFEASEYWNSLAALRSRKLTDYAEKLYITVNDLKWERDQYANYYLDRPSQSKLYRSIVEERRRIWDFRIKVIGALTGLIGTIIGLVAVWKK